MPTFTFYDLQKQPYKCSEIKIIRTVDLTVCILYILFAGPGQLILNTSASSAAYDYVRLTSKLLELPEDWKEFCIGIQYAVITDIILGYMDISLRVSGFTCQRINNAQICRNCTLECTIKANGTNHITVRYTFTSMLLDRQIEYKGARFFTSSYCPNFDRS